MLVRFKRLSQTVTFCNDFNLSDGILTQLILVLPGSYLSPHLVEIDPVFFWQRLVHVKGGQL